MDTNIFGKPIHSMTNEELLDNIEMSSVMSRFHTDPQRRADHDKAYKAMRDAAIERMEER